MRLDENSKLCDLSFDEFLKFRQNKNLKSNNISTNTLKSNEFKTFSSKKIGIDLFDKNSADEYTECIFFNLKIFLSIFLIISLKKNKHLNQNQLLHNQQITLLVINRTQIHLYDQQIRLNRFQEMTQCNHHHIVSIIFLIIQMQTICTRLIIRIKTLTAMIRMFLPNLKYLKQIASHLTTTFQMAIVITI
jgi:hypothetical protein